MNEIEDILALYVQRGDLAYEGEGVNQLQHAWQCGQLARRAGAAPTLQLAAWLHDVGHLMTALPGSPTLAGIDDRHETVAAVRLEPLFGRAVAGPVALHVDAKRYLIARRPEYAGRLSADSVRSLALQGGPMKDFEANRFETRAYAQDALRLRSWDDAGKVGRWQPASADDALRDLGMLMLRVRALTVTA